MQDADPDREVCGIIMIVAGRGGFLAGEAVQLANRSRHPSGSFRISRDDLVVRPPYAIFHSHPTGAAHPSWLDRAAMRRRSGVWFIFSPTETTAYLSGRHRFRPLEVCLLPSGAKPRRR
jgi:proteasome lid subunit RPN8/RPN11